MNVLHIATREFRATFSGVVGWLIACGFLLVTGVFWHVWGVMTYVTQSENLVFDPYGASQLNLTDYLLAPFFNNVAIILMFIVPALSMGMYAEEIKLRTLELLLTSPVSTLEIVLGKFLGALGVLGVLLIGTTSGPLVLWTMASPDPGALLGGYLGLLILGGALLALGAFASSLTANQIVALVLSFSASLILLAVAAVSDDPTSPWAQISIFSHLSSILQGEVKLSDLVYFAGFTFAFLFATHQRMESFRWK